MEHIPINASPNDEGGGRGPRLAVHLETPEEPSSTAVLYLHGFGSRQSGTKAEFFRRRFLDLGLAVCSFDFRGHGESDGSMFDLTLTRNLADTACAQRFLERHGYSSVVLMGSSMGGGTALWYAGQNPEAVAAAIHLAPSVALDQGLLDSVGPEKARQWERDGKLFFEHELVQCDVGWELIEDLGRYRIDHLKSVYRTPSLIFQGKNDTSVPWRKVLDFVVGCEYEEIDLHLMAGADHRMVDRLDHLWRVTEAFLITRNIVS